MLHDIDDACTQAKVMPDVFPAAHAHNYQRYTRTLDFEGRQIDTAFIVAGMGGYAQATVPEATGQRDGDHTFVKSRKGFGYLLVEATANAITVRSIGVDPDSGAKTTVDTVRVALP
jgi:hypothetical protein